MSFGSNMGVIMDTRRFQHAIEDLAHELSKRGWVSVPRSRFVRWYEQKHYSPKMADDFQERLTEIEGGDMLVYGFEGKCEDGTLLFVLTKKQAWPPLNSHEHTCKTS